jgi:hypothetical protein
VTELHTEDAHIRRAMNWQNAPGYNLAKMFKYIVESHISVPKSFNVKKKSLPLFKTQNPYR